VRLGIYVRWETETAEHTPAMSRRAAVASRLVLLAALAVLCLPLAALASDSFSDVPDSHPFHNAIKAIYGARITTGCAPGQYCPENFVTRGEMAAFMQRGFGRIAMVQPVANVLTLHNYITVGTLTIVSGGGSTGGTGFVKVDASFTLFNANTSGCPCEVQYFLKHVNSSTNSRSYYVTVLNDVGGTDSNVSGAVSWAVPADTAVTQTFQLHMLQTSGTASTITVVSGMTAIYAPFGGTGGATLAKTADDAPAAPDAPAGKP
jgi:hypothetical protein